MSNVDIFSENLFNKSILENKNMSWRNLTLDERVNSVKQFFTDSFDMKVNSKDEICSVSKNIDIKTIKTIIDIVNSGNLRLKKEVVYDNVNKRIISIKALIFNSKKNKYIYNPDFLIKKKNSSKIAKGILFRCK